MEIFVTIAGLFYNAPLILFPLSGYLSLPLYS